MEEANKNRRRIIWEGLECEPGYAVLRPLAAPQNANARVILYAEDDMGIIYDAVENLVNAFPTMEIRIAKDKKRALEAIGGNISKLEFVITDGNLSKGKGWELAQDLRNLGYQGDIYYSGACPSDIPGDCRKLFAVYTNPFNNVTQLAHVNPFNYVEGIRALRDEKPGK